MQECNVSATPSYEHERLDRVVRLLKNETVILRDWDTDEELGKLMLSTESVVPSDEDEFQSAGATLILQASGAAPKVLLAFPE